MNVSRLLILMCIGLLAGCKNHNAEAVGGGKIDGPNLKSLNHDELMAVLHECHRYGSSDDPRVKYTILYCSAAQSAHAMEGYSAPASAAVDPSLNKMH